jgi:hypothetical protein
VLIVNEFIQPFIHGGYGVKSKHFTIWNSASPCKTITASITGTSTSFEIATSSASGGLLAMTTLVQRVDSLRKFAIISTGIALPTILLSTESAIEKGIVRGG